jgi:hypothetical protein
MKAIRMFALLASILITAVMFGAIADGLAVRPPSSCAAASTAP